MAEYEIEWTEHRKMRARIQAPPNDERVLEAAKEIINVAGTPMPRLIAWAYADHREARKTTDGLNDVQHDITLVGKVVSVEDPIDPNFPDIASMREEVHPL